MITVEHQVLRVPGVTETVISPPALNPTTGKWERYYKFFDGADAPVFTLYVQGDSEDDVALPVPEHLF